MKGLFIAILMTGATATGVFSQGRALTFDDIMKWEDINHPAISDDGEWLAYSVWPDRGDGEVRVHSVDGNSVYSIERGDNPVIAGNGRWVAAYRKPRLADELKAGKEKPVQGLALLNTVTGTVTEKDSVQSFMFSDDGEWIALHHHPTANNGNSDIAGRRATLHNLESGTDYEIPFVKEMAFDSSAHHLVYSIVDTSAGMNGLYFRDLSGNAEEQHVIESAENRLFSSLRWHNRVSRLAFTEAIIDTAETTGDASLKLWDADTREVTLLVDSASTGGEWALRAANSLRWTKDGERLFFGLIPRDIADLERKPKKKDRDTSDVDIYDMEKILSEKEMDVWHWNDPRIKTHEKNSWNQRKSHLYRAVYHLDEERWIRLADRDMPDVVIPENDRYALGRSQIPYLKEMTWDGFYNDYFIVDLETGERRKIADRLRTGARLSPGGNYVTFFRNRDWHLYDIENDLYRNLTEELDVPFYDEDHDYPYTVPGYGTAGWTDGDEHVLIYDKYDIWKFSAAETSAPLNLTQDGREREIRYRIERLDRNRDTFSSEDELLLAGYYDRKKYYGLYSFRPSEAGVIQRMEEQKRFNIISKAENSDRILYSRESYDEYPNLWVSEDLHFDEVKRISELHLDLHDTYNWGRAELIEWHSLHDGRTLQGAVIKPDNYEEGKRYPVLVYFYRFFSQRAYQFNNITNDDRPTLPQWVSDGYVVFLPDIRFEVGTPGFTSTKSLVPGVQKLIDMGIAHPDKIGLHGHSWSGYQTAFIITQTDIFDAAISGAPVSNMTSAYSGIRWGSGLARQFQYEKTQSRIGGSLWEYPERYVENSPVFYADRINTPVLIMFGDEDTAVPWYQGIELYLAMRRLEKDAIFLQYHKEPHHLRKYANRLDYAIKMKEYFDHYLRGYEAPEWIRDGVPYRGD